MSQAIRFCPMTILASMSTALHPRAAQRLSMWQKVWCVCSMLPSFRYTRLSEFRYMSPFPVRRFPVQRRRLAPAWTAVVDSPRSPPLASSFCWRDVERRHSQQRRQLLSVLRCVGTAILMRAGRPRPGLACSAAERQAPI